MLLAQEQMALMKVLDKDGSVLSAEEWLHNTSDEDQTNYIQNHLHDFLEYLPPSYKTKWMSYSEGREDTLANTPKKTRGNTYMEARKQVLSKTLEKHTQRIGDKSFTPEDIVVISTAGVEDWSPSHDIVDWCLEHKGQRVFEFNQPIDINPGMTNCDYLLYGCLLFNQDVIIPPNVTSAVGMFNHCSNMYGQLYAPSSLKGKITHPRDYNIIWYDNEEEYHIHRYNIKLKSIGVDETLDMVNNNYKKNIEKLMC